MIRCLAFALSLLIPLSSWSQAADDAPVRVRVVYAGDSPALERFAAEELAGQFRRLFENIDVTTGTADPGDGSRVVLVGSPRTNPAVGQAVGNDWPDLSNQGMVIRSFLDDARQGLIVGGGSPAATLWAVYELGHRLGIRYLIREDVFPLSKSPLKLDGFGLAIEPQIRTRAWQSTHVAWGLEDHKRNLQQLAKLKFNHLVFSVAPFQPFVDYEFGGVKKQTAELWEGRERIRVDGDTVGKKVFDGARFFDNPDFVGKTSFEDKTAAGVQQFRGIIDEAHRLGMTVSLGFSPLQFPREFRQALPPAQNRKKQSPGGGEQSTFIATPQSGNGVVRRLVETKIRAYLKTYPAVDSLCLHLTHRLDATQRKLLEDVLAEPANLRRPDGADAGLSVILGRPAPDSVERIIPEGTATVHVVDSSARRIAGGLPDSLDAVSSDKRPTRLFIPLDNPHAGVLPQSSLENVARLAAELRRRRWDGFVTSWQLPGERDLEAHFLSRSAWNFDLTPRSAHDDLWGTITDNKAAAERLWLGWQHLEQGTALIDQQGDHFAAAGKEMLLQHHRPDPIPDWWTDAVEHYNQVVIELYRARGAIDPENRPLLFYSAKRGQYALSYLAAVQAVREAAIAQKAGDTEAAIGHLETAIESIYNGITFLADVARDQSDRALIARLNAHAYRPLFAEYERLLDEADK